MSLSTDRVKVAQKGSEQGQVVYSSSATVPCLTKSEKEAIKKTGYWFQASPDNLSGPVVPLRQGSVLETYQTLLSLPMANLL